MLAYLGCRISEWIVYKRDSTDYWLGEQRYTSCRHQAACMRKPVLGITRHSNNIAFYRTADTSVDVRLETIWQSVLSFNVACIKVNTTAASEKMALSSLIIYIKGRLPISQPAGTTQPAYKIVEHSLFYMCTACSHFKLKFCSIYNLWKWYGWKSLWRWNITCHIRNLLLAGINSGCLPLSSLHIYVHLTVVFYWSLVGYCNYCLFVSDR